MALSSPAASSALVALLTSACGRVGFDASAGSDAIAGCALFDDFEDGEPGDWIVREGSWSAVAGRGPDGSWALQSNAGTGWHTVSHVALMNRSRVHLALDIYLEHIYGDLMLHLVEPGWTPPVATNGVGHAIGIFPVGGDSSPDYIAAQVFLDMRAPSIAHQTWYHLDVLIERDRIEVELDEQLVMSALTTVSMLPQEVTITAWAQGVIDNVAVDCTR